MVETGRSPLLRNAGVEEAGGGEATQIVKPDGLSMPTRSRSRRQVFVQRYGPHGVEPSWPDPLKSVHP